MSEAAIGKIEEPKKRRSFKKAAADLLVPLAITAATVGAIGVGGEVGSVAKRIINNPNPATPGRIVEDIKAGTGDFVSDVESVLNSTESKPSFKGFGGGRSGGGGAGRNFDGGKGGMSGGGGTSR